MAKWGALEVALCQFDTPPPWLGLRQLVKKISLRNDAKFVSKDKGKFLKNWEIFNGGFLFFSFF